MAVGAVVAVAAVVGLAIQAVSANATVRRQLASTPVHDAALDNAFYSCLDVQARSLVAPREPVTIAASSLYDFITLLQGVGSWVTIADPASSAVAQLSLRDGVRGPGACRGTVVVAHYTTAHDGSSVRIGTGASCAGNGPPPPPPL